MSADIYPELKLISADQWNYATGIINICRNLPGINPFTVMMSFENDPQKVRNLKPLSLFVFFFAQSCKRIFTKAHSIESRCYRTGKYTVCRRVLSSLSPEILQAGTVKGLKLIRTDHSSQATGIIIIVCRNLPGIRTAINVDHGLVTLQAHLQNRGRTSRNHH